MKRFAFPIPVRLALVLASMLGASTASAQEAAARYWSDRWRGWHFYEDPMPEEQERPPLPGKGVPAAPPALPSKAPELVEFERLQKTLEDTRNIAIMRPTEANVRRYMELESQVIARASYFADVAQRVAWATPALDPTLQGRPVAFGAAGHLGVNTPIAGAEVQARAGKNYQSGLSAAQQKVLNSLTQEQIAEFKQFGDRVSRDSSLINSFAKDSREAQEMSSRLASAVSRSERADAAFTERTAFAERVSSAKDRGESLSIDIAQDPHNLEMFLRYAEQYGGDSASALSMFDAELARQGLRPNRVFSDGTALPSSFGDVRTLHDRQSSDPALSPDLSASNRQQRAKVARFNHPAPSARPDTSPSSLRNDVQTQGNAIRSETASARSAFDRKAEIVEAADGTLVTRKSLLKQSGKQVVDDGEATIDNAKEAVRGLLRKNE